MGKILKGKVRIYFLDKPSFLSCGNAYITDENNLIIMHDDNYGRDDTLKLRLRMRGEMPYTLAPYPIGNNNGSRAIRNGIKVFPSCDVDFGRESKPKEVFVPKVVGLRIILRGRLDGFVQSYLDVAKEYRKTLAEALRMVDDKYRPIINQARLEAKKGCVAPNLANMILEG